MKTIVLHITGLAGDPHESLDGRTLLEASKSEALDEIARHGSAGRVRLLGDEVIAGAGAELLALLGYLEPDAEPPSLGILEAVGAQVPLYSRDVALRVNLSSLDDDGVIVDTSGGGAPLEELLTLMELVDEKLSTRRIRFYPGRLFAHIMVWTDGPSDLFCTPAPLARGKPLEEVLPRGTGDAVLRQLIWDSVELLDKHRINYRRRDEGLPPVNLIWPWAPGRAREFRHFALKVGITATVMTSRLEVMGAARAVGIPVLQNPAALDACRTAASEAAKCTTLTYLHVDLPEHFEHPEDPEAHVQTFEALDTGLVGRLLEEVRTGAEAARMVIVGTWREDKWSPRPYALWGTWPGIYSGAKADCFTEAALGEQGALIAEPNRLLTEALSAG